MPTPLIPQEIYLLERYSSLDYFGEMRDAWASMVKAAEEALDQFMRKLPLDYRRRDLSRQPDIVWGERVLPNFRSTLESLNTGYILLSRGDLSALALGGNVMSNIKGQTSDYLADWMPKELEDRFWYWQGEAGTRAFNVSITEYAGWVMTDLTSRYSAQSRGILAAPPSWPVYRLNPAIIATTGQPVGHSGIYLPACDDSCAEVLIQGYDAFRARVGFDSRTTHSVSRTATTWTLVERIADSGGGLPGQEDSSTSTIAVHSTQRRAPGGEACPQSGWWHTPAKTGSRRYFKAGEVMPVFEGSPYGSTIWQWDVDQSAPRL